MRRKSATCCRSTSPRLLPPDRAGSRYQCAHIHRSCRRQCASKIALTFELHLSNVDEDILRREADIAIRMHRPTQTGLVARKIGEVGLGLFASKKYCSKEGLPANINDLERASLVGQDKASSIRDAFTAAGLPLNATFAFRTDNDIAQLALIGAGVGIGVCQVGVAEKKGFVRVLPNLEVSLEVWLTMHEDLRTTGRYRATFDHLASFLA
ncbi:MULTISPECIES: substrate-binding domain-containing protein [unclassified Rhizobium]|uniref:substrate-binding domain-containing protein n=1 Tax=unclassified Rhizobium TaxID=2613769 RepID=UPI00216975D0|nr:MULTISPECIES: substrate-binding domain-containing protein [unclassified Rhizobium]